jgi:hypothetical protein
MSAGMLAAFDAELRPPTDYLYLLLDPLAPCATEHALHIDALTRQLGEDALTRVPRPDLAHQPRALPALMTLARPGVAPDPQLLALIEATAQQDAGYRKRYVCALLTSATTPDVVAEQIVDLCRHTAIESAAFVPQFEPLRMELLMAALRQQLGGFLWPINHWLLPTSWGGFATLSARAKDESSPLPEVALHAQREAPLVADVLAAWRRATQLRLPYAPRAWQGLTVLPPQAAATAFRMIRTARTLGLGDRQNILTLTLHRLLIHPRLHEHERVRVDIAHAARGDVPLAELFATYHDRVWMNIATYLDAPQEAL